MIEEKQLEQERISKRLIPVLVGVSVLVLTLTVFRPSLITVGKLRLENLEAKKRLAALVRKRQLLQSLDEEEVNARVQKLEEVFPSQKPTLNLMATVIKIAAEEGVAFSGIELEPGRIKTSAKIQKQGGEKEIQTEEKKLEEFVIKFSIEGGLPQINSFISQLEKAAPLMKIEELGINLKIPPSASLTVSVYFQAFPDYLGPIDRVVPLLTQGEKDILMEIEPYRKAEVIQANAPVGKEDLFSLPGE